MLEELNLLPLPLLTKLIGTQQSNPTTATTTALNELMNFLATHPNGIIRYYASDMILHVDTNAAYLVLPNAKSSIAG